MALISTYQICQWKNTGGITSRAQQVAWLCKNNRQINPIAAHREDLFQLIDGLRNHNIEILLAGDFNEHDMNKGTLYELCRHGLIPINNVKPRESYQRGKTCLDHMFATSKLIQNIDDVKYNQYPSTFDTDHRPMEVTLNFSTLKQQSDVYNAHQDRRLYSNNWNGVRKYILRRLRLYTHYKIEEKLNRIEALVQNSKTKEDPQLCETIASMVDQVDRQHTRICLESERSLQQKKGFKKPAEVKDILQELHKIRYEMRHCKKNTDILKLKGLMKEKRSANRRLVNVYKNQWRVEESRNHKEIKIMEALEPCGKKAAGDRSRDLSQRKLKNMYRKISFYTGKRQDTECMKLMSEGQWVHDPEEKLETIVNHNKKHFMQAKGCNFSRRELQGVVDPQSAVFDEGSMSVLETEFIQELRSQSLPSITEFVDLHDWKRKFKTWRESTRTSPSGMHLGHFKSLLSNIYKVEEEKCEVDIEIFSAQQELFGATLRILNLAIAAETPLTRWKTAANIVIPKKKGTYEPKNLRNIHIYECDLNALLSLKLKEALEAAENTEFMVQSQFGSRKHKSSQDPVSLENAQLEIARLTRKQYGQINYDARACYDRILPNLAAMTSLVHGVPKPLVKLHNRLLAAMKYEIMIEGASTSAVYTSDEHNMVYGTGQGCGNSPFIWLFISNVLLKMFNRSASGAQYSSQKTGNQISIHASAYVDDINSHHNEYGIMNCLEEQMKLDFQKWKDLLEMSGGSLAQEKCSFYKVKWDFHNSGKPEMEDGHHDVMHFENTDLKIHSIDHQHRTLGFYVSPKMPRKFQIQQWKDVEERFGIMLDAHDLQYKEAEILYQRIYVPTVRYFLPLTTLNGKEIQQITRSTFTKFLRKCGYSNTTAREAVYGSKNMGGLGWFDMEVEQGLHNVATLVQSCYNTGIMGSLFQILLERWCWFTGFCPLQHHLIEVTYDESVWLSSTASFMKKNGITLTMENHAPPLLRESDEYIMIIVHQMNLSATETRYINYCRLFLNVISIADLTDAEGKYIRQEMYNNPSQCMNHTDSTCIQSSVPIRKWSLWRKVLNHITFYKRRKLKTNLGKWIVPSNLIRHRYSYYFNSERLYHQTSDRIKIYEFNDITKGKEIGQGLQIPHNAYPCEVTSTGRIVANINNAVAIMVGTVEEFEYGGSIIAVTDASVVGNQGTWAAILTDSDGKEIHQIQGSISGDSLTSFRAELDGCRGVLTLLKKYPKVTTITLFCDNIAVIHRLNSLQTTWPSINWSDYDLLMEAKLVMPQRIQFKHVKGHQGSSCHPNFNLETNLNILMDTRAKKAQENPLPHETKPNFAISYRGNSITGSIVKTLREEISNTRLRVFYQNKMREHYEEVHWDAFQYAGANGRITRSIFKMIHNIAPNFQTLQKRGLSPDALCPICFQHDETNMHILICPSRSDIYNTTFCKKLCTRLKVKTEEDTQLAENIFASITANPQGELQNIVFANQFKMGWGHCVRGFFTKEWIEVAKLFKTDKPDKEIIGGIIIEIRNIWHAAWAHRNELLKKENRYLAQCAIKQTTVDLHIIYGCRDYIPIELQGVLKISVEDHLKMDESVIDEWLKMYRPIF